MLRMTDDNFLWIELIADKDICVLISKPYAGAVILRKEIEYKSTIMEMRNIIKNQERVIEQLMFDMLNIKIDIEEVDEVDEVSKV